MQYAKLIAPHIDALWFTALRLTRNREDAEDLVQETCLRALEHLGSLRAEGKAKAWLFKILTNTFINTYRRQRASPVDADLEPDFLESIAYKSGRYVDLEREVFSKILGDEIREAIERLPVEFRMVVLLVDVEEFSYREVQDMLKISPGTLASRLYRGRRLLRDTLHAYAKTRNQVKEETGGMQ